MLPNSESTKRAENTFFIHTFQFGIWLSLLAREFKSEFEMRNHLIFVCVSVCVCVCVRKHMCTSNVFFSISYIPFI